MTEMSGKRRPSLSQALAQVHERSRSERAGIGAPCESGREVMGMSDSGSGSSGNFVAKGRTRAATLVYGDYARVKESRSGSRSGDGSESDDSTESGINVSGRMRAGSLQLQRSSHQLGAAADSELRHALEVMLVERDGKPKQSRFYSESYRFRSAALARLTCADSGQGKAEEVKQWKELSKAEKKHELDRMGQALSKYTMKTQTRSKEPLEGLPPPMLSPEHSLSLLTPISPKTSIVDFVPLSATPDIADSLQDLASTNGVEENKDSRRSSEVQVEMKTQTEIQNSEKDGKPKKESVETEKLRVAETCYLTEILSQLEFHERVRNEMVKGEWRGDED